MVKLNKTPVRTANNFGINDIELELNIPEVKKYNNITIMGYDMDDVAIIRNNIESEKMLNSKIGLEMNKIEEITIRVPENRKISSPIEIEFNLDEDNNVLVDEINIIMEAKSEANFIIKYQDEGLEENEGFHYLKQKNTLKSESKAFITIANLLSNKSKSFIAIENNVEENAKIEHTLIEFGGNTKISNYYSKLTGDFSENNIKTIYLGTQQDIIDINYNIEAYGKNAKCNIEAQGAIKDKAKKSFKGTIDFKKGCKKAKGIENENCMILSDEAKSKSLPMLLCHEEDVEGEHGVASGKLAESKLFYIMTKGISYEDAKKLIVKANFSQIIRTIPNEELQKQVADLV